MILSRRLVFKFLLLAVIIFSLFVLFSYWLHRNPGRFRQFDFDTTVHLQDRIPRKLDFSFSVLSLLGTAEITGLVWVCMLVYSLFRRWWEGAISLFLFPVALFVELFGKIFLYHPGPPILFYRGVIPAFFPSSFIQTNYSYPSGHVTRWTFLTILICFWIYEKTHSHRWVAICMSLLLLLAMTISRVYLGEHWTTDVVGGFLLGSSLGVVAGVMTLISLKRLNKQTKLVHNTQR